MSEALDLCAPAKHPRLCLDCHHIHGVLAYGLCFERLPNGDICPCTELRTARPRRHQRPAEAVTARTLSRWAARMFEEMSPAERTKYIQWARRWVDSELELAEFAAEAGIDQKLLWRTWKLIESVDRRGTR